jgi:DNA polymerase-3 subunit gamma/tau
VLNQPAVPEAERKRGGALAKDLSLPVLARAWQMLLKGLGEAQYAPQPLAAAEMALIRLLHVADLPTPGDLVRQLSGGAPGPGGNASAPRGPAPSGGAGGGFSTGGNAVANRAVAREPAPNPQTAPTAALAPMPTTFAAVVALFAARREGILHTHLQNDVHLVNFEVGRIELRPTQKAPANLPNRIAACLNEWTGSRWLVSVSGDLGAPTLKEQAQAADAEMRRRAAEHPLVKAVLDAFPGATIDAVRDLKAAQPAAPSADGDDDVAPEPTPPEDEA